MANGQNRGKKADTKKTSTDTVETKSATTTTSTRTGRSVGGSTDDR